MTKRKSFILHHDSLEVLNELSDEQAGKLFKAIFSYQKSREHELEGLMNAVFLSFKNQFDRDDERYQKICERNKNNGLSGGRPKPKITQSVIYGEKITQHNPKEPDNDSVNGNDNGNESKDYILPPDGVTKKNEKPAKKKGTRLSDDWIVTEELGEWAMKEGLTHEQVCNEIYKFRDYWKAKAGAGGIKLDWDATFRNWIRSASERKKA